MYHVYVLQSETHGRYYIGSTSDIESRVERHNRGRNKSTKSGLPWRLVHSETFPTKQEAYRREMQLKRYKGGEAFKKLLSDNR